MGPFPFARRQLMSSPLWGTSRFLSDVALLGDGDSYKNANHQNQPRQRAAEASRDRTMVLPFFEGLTERSQDVAKSCAPKSALTSLTTGGLNESLLKPGAQAF